MSTKNLARTAIEIGRHSTWERNQSHRTERARMRVFLSKAKQDPDIWESADPEARPKVWRDQQDKFGAINRYLQSQIGRMWDDVRSEIVRRFNSNTIAGHHILYDHILEHMVAYEHHHHSKFANFVVKADGTLSKGEYPWRRHRYQFEKISDKARSDFYWWLLDYRIVEMGKEVFWADPQRWSWSLCSKHYNPRTGKWAYHGREGGCIASAHEMRTTLEGKEQLWHRTPHNWRQGKKLSRKDRAYWDQLPEFLKQHAHHVTTREFEEQWRARNREAKKERGRLLALGYI